MKIVMRENRLLKMGFLLLLAIFFSGCGKRATPPEINFKDTVEIEEPLESQGNEISIGVGSMITPEEGHVYYKELLEYIGKKLGMRVKFVERETYAEINALLENGGIAVAFVCGGPYIRGHKDFGLELLVAPQVDGKAVYYSYIIVAKDSAIKQFEELNGKTFAFVDPLSNTGMLYPRYLLLRMGESPENFFKNVVYTYSHDNSIKAVAQGLVDAAAVDSLVWDYLDKRGSRYTTATKIIKVSEPFGIPPVVVSPKLNRDLKKKIKDILLNIHTQKEGKDILQGMFIEKFVEVNDSMYDGIRGIEKTSNK